MPSVAEFIAVRERIESLARQIVLSVGSKTAQDSKPRFDEAVRQLEILKTMVANDVQVISVERLTRQLAGFATKVKTTEAKKPAKKKAQTAT